MIYISSLQVLITSLKSTETFFPKIDDPIGALEIGQSAYIVHTPYLGKIDFPRVNPTKGLPRTQGSTGRLNGGLAFPRERGHEGMHGCTGLKGEYYCHFRELLNICRSIYNTYIPYDKRIQ